MSDRIYRNISTISSFCVILKVNGCQILVVLILVLIICIIVNCLGTHLKYLQVSWKKYFYMKNYIFLLDCFKNQHRFFLFFFLESNCSERTWKDNSVNSCVFSEILALWRCFNCFLLKKREFYREWAPENLSAIVFFSKVISYWTFFTPRKRKQWSGLFHWVSRRGC